MNVRTARVCWTQHELHSRQNPQRKTHLQLEAFNLTNNATLTTDLPRVHTS